MLAKILDLYLALRNFLLGEPLIRIQRNARDSNPISHDIWDQLLRKHVKGAQLDYQGFQTDRKQLQQYLDLLSQNPPHPANWSEGERLAFWINAYNAFTVELVLRYYPLDSIKHLGKKLQIPFVNSVWDLGFFRIAGQKTTLNIIEHQILRKHFKEARIHFAINCASFSCPRLREEAYTAEKLEEQLEEQARDFINDPDKNRITAQKGEFSQIFQWYEGDFAKKKSLKEYINFYSEQRLGKNADTSYILYDWSLNDVIREND